MAGTAADAPPRHPADRLARPRLSRPRGHHQPGHRGRHSQPLPRRLHRQREHPRRTRRPARTQTPRTAGPHRAPQPVHCPLPRQGHQGQAGAEPPEGAGADGDHRPAACHPRHRFRVCPTTRGPRSTDPRRAPRLRPQPAAARRHAARTDRAPWRPHRHSGPQRHRQDHADPHADRRSGTPLRRPHPCRHPRYGLPRPGADRRPAPRRLPTAAPGPPGTAGARAGAARLPGRLRLFGRRRAAPHRADVRRRKDPPVSGPAGLGEARFSGAGRTHQPPRRQHPRRTGRRPGRIRRPAAAGLARPLPAAQHRR